MAVLAAIEEVLDPGQTVRVGAGGRGDILIAFALTSLEILVVQVTSVLRGHVRLTGLIRSEALKIRTQKETNKRASRTR